MQMMKQSSMMGLSPLVKVHVMWYRMKQTELGAAIEAAKGEATEVKTVKVDIFDIPETKAKEYIATREEVAKAAMEVMKPYCVTVKRETLDEDERGSRCGLLCNGRNF